MIKRSLVLSVAASLLVISLAAADPRLEVRHGTGWTQLTLTGDFSGSGYTMARASAREGPYSGIVEVNALCFGSCFGVDDTAKPGSTYWYRFDLVGTDGTPTSYGPFPVSIPAPARLFSAGLFPNPGNGASHVDLFYSGAAADPAVPASAILFDLHGRRLATLWSGPLRTGLTRLAWDGRDQNGRMLDPGRYFLRFTTPRGATVFGVTRIR